MSQYDFMPTLLDYLGLPDPNDDMSPGRSFLPALSGETNDAWEEIVVFDEYGPVRMIRTQEWKYVHRYPYGRTSSTTWCTTRGNAGTWWTTGPGRR